MFEQTWHRLSRYIAMLFSGSQLLACLVLGIVHGDDEGWRHESDLRARHVRAALEDSSSIHGRSMGPEYQVEHQWFYIDGPGAPEFERHWAPAHWANADAGVELRYLPVWARVYLGVSQLLNVDDFSCTGEDIGACESSLDVENDRTYHPSETYPYLGVSFGVAF